jgi:hypothetical protein
LRRRPVARPNTTRSISEFEPSRLAPCTETQAASPTANRPGTTVSGLPSFSVDDLAVIIGRDAAHIIMDRRRDRQRLARQIDAGEDLARLGDAGQALVQHLGIDMIEVKVDMILVLADAAALADLHRHRARHDVAAGKVLRDGA